ncbi:MAG: sulfatase [Planctomycetota bacterium]
MTPTSRFIVAAGFLAILAGMPPAIGSAESAPTNRTPPPNVLLIVIDDLNTDIGCMDGGGITPHIDRLAQRGVLFDNAHCNAPVCNPSRSSFLTGLLPPNLGVYENKAYFRDLPGHADRVTLPRHFRDHGYRAVGSGKIFHSGWQPKPSHPLAKHWDREASWSDYAELPYGTPTPKPALNKWHRGEVKTYWGKSFWWGQTHAADEDCGDFQNARFTADFLQGEHDQPFFLACGIFRPHLPFVAPRPYFKQYPLEDIEWPAGVKHNDLNDLPPFGKKYARRTGLNAAIRKENRWKQAIQAYRASTTFADAAVGQVLDALDSSPHRDNTLVVLISDHGFHLGEKNHWTKFTFWDRSTRVPMIVAGPGIAPGRSPRTVSLVDLFPTLNEFCGLPALEAHDGQSFASLLANPEAEHPAVARVFHDAQNHQAVIDEDFRYIRYANGEEELYDRRADPHDWHNLADDPGYAATLDRYRAQRFLPNGTR